MNNPRVLTYLLILAIPFMLIGYTSAQQSHPWSEITNLPGTVWHSGNDGPGSGLDADMLDSYHASDFFANDFWSQSGSSIYYNTGNVGIGTSNPQARLQVAGNIMIPANTGALIADWGSDDWTLIAGSGGDTHISRNDMVITQTGNVGIGVANPAAKLDVNGNVRIRGKPNCGKLYTDSSGNVLCGTDNAGTSLWSQSGSSIYYNTGNVGIGTSTPQAKLDVNGVIGVKGQGVLSADSSSIAVGDLSGGDGLRALRLRAGDGDRIYITTGGNVGIGTTDPGTSRLKVNGNTYVTGTLRTDGGLTVDGRTMISGTGYYHTARATDNTHYGYFEVRRNDNTRGAYFGYGDGGNRVNLLLDNANTLYISGGNVGIGVANPSEALDVNGYVKGRTGLCIGNDCRTAWPSGRPVISPVYSQGTVSGPWTICFVFQSDDGASCRTSGTVDGSWTFTGAGNCRWRCLRW